ncbi:MAG: D-alanyl-D-alanine carboxypeptidase [Halieaceae bacterium]|nr:D-alanyl-D-alanine carboxypeptidase [Halieaceae bacterium]
MIRFFLVLLLTLGSNLHADSIVPMPPNVAAKAYLLIDAGSGEILAEKNIDMQLPPASLTKLMTSYVLSVEISAGRVGRDDLVVISENSWSQNPLFKGSSLMFIEPGMDVLVQDLQRGIIISSGNDATVAVAEHLAGSESAFADMMNGHAEALGMSGSYFVNSHGLPDPDHVITARDLATLAKAQIVDYPEDYAIYKEREFTYNDIRQYNRNTLLREDPSVDGLKTGHTTEAGYGLVASAERRGMRLISVVLGTTSELSRKNESRSLFNYGFRFFETVSLFGNLEELSKPRIWGGQQDFLPLGVLSEITMTLPRGKKGDLKTVIEVDEDIVAPVALGDRLGTINLSLDGEIVFDAPLVALAAVESSGFFSQLWDTMLMWVARLFRA